MFSLYLASTGHMGIFTAKAKGTDLRQVTNTPIGEEFAGWGRSPSKVVNRESLAMNAPLGVVSRGSLPGLCLPGLAQARKYRFLSFPFLDLKEHRP